MAMENVLLAEDEQKLREIVAKYLKKEGYHVYEAEDGEQALELFREKEMDIVILDVMMPGIDGWSCCREIRKTSDVPIIMLTARSEENDRVFGFELGADDYVTKPFSNRELMMRVRSLIRRSVRSADSNILEAGKIKINVRAHRVILDGKELELSPKEYDLLMLFWENADIALSRETIIDKIWGYDYYGDMRTIDTHIKRLRSKIKDSGCEIQTVRGVGYRFYIEEDEGK